MSKITPEYPGCRVSCVITSDTHVDVLNPVPAVPMFFLKRVLKDSDSAKNKQDALIIIGDTTSRGNSENWALVEKCFRKYPKPAKNILFPLGNHDTGNDGGFNKAIEEYFTATKIITGEDRTVQYFSCDLNGYKFIFTGATDDINRFPVIGEQQLQWLDEQLAEGTADGRPVFVFNHETLNRRHGLPKTFDREIKPDVNPDEGGIGPESEKYEAILKKYKNVYFFTGHSHMGFCGEKNLKENGFSSFEQEGDLTLVNLPSNGCGNFWGENNRNNVGLVLEVYDGKVVIRPRDFLLGKWFNKVIIQAGKPYFEKKY